MDRRDQMLNTAMVNAMIDNVSEILEHKCIRCINKMIISRSNGRKKLGIDLIHESKMSALARVCHQLDETKLGKWWHSMLRHDKLPFIQDLLLGIE
jgi:hypothetical protein